MEPKYAISKKIVCKIYKGSKPTLVDDPKSTWEFDDKVMDILKSICTYIATF